MEQVLGSVASPEYFGAWGASIQLCRNQKVYPQYVDGFMKNPQRQWMIWKPPHLGNLQGWLKHAESTFKGCICWAWHCEDVDMTHGSLNLEHGTLILVCHHWECRLSCLRRVWIMPHLTDNSSGLLSIGACHAQISAICELHGLRALRLKGEDTIPGSNCCLPCAVDLNLTFHVYTSHACWTSPTHVTCSSCSYMHNHNTFLCSDYTKNSWFQRQVAGTTYSTYISNHLMSMSHFTSGVSNLEMVPNSAPLKYGCVTIVGPFCARPIQANGQWSGSSEHS